jgi:hypothetical protein
VLGFWAWGIWAGMGASALARRLRLPSVSGVLVAALPIALNWSAVSRRSELEASLPREVATALLTALPSRSVLFVAGDNDTYPLWYAQQVERIRRDVTVVTLPLLAANWYVNELARRDSLVAPDRVSTMPVSLGEIAAAAEQRGRPVAVAVTVPIGDRNRIGRSWKVIGPALLAVPRAVGSEETAQPASVQIDTAATLASSAAIESWRKGRGVRPSLDPVHEYFLNVLSCPRLALTSTPSRTQLASLDSTCNLR